MRYRVDRAGQSGRPPTVMIAADATDANDRFTVYGGIMARSPGNATLVSVPPASTLFGVSMPASPYGTLAAVTRPSWAPSGVDIDKPSVARVCDYILGHADVDRYTGVARIG
jgi:hypothetical protein